MSERHGIEIDYCASCRGVWLDRGELDKIIERSAGHEESSDTRERGERGIQPESSERREERVRRDDDDDDFIRRGGRRRERGGFLGDLFDF